MKKIEVAILLDTDNTWIEKYIKKIQLDKELNKKYDFYFFKNESHVKNFKVVFILGYTKILKKSFLQSNDISLVVHESDLPKGKGFSPVQWQVLEKKSIIPVCLIEATEKVDSGDIFEKGYIKLDGDELFDQIREKQGLVTIQLIKAFLLKYPENRSKKQVGEETFYRRRNEKDDELDVNKTIKEQFDYFRIANNEEYPVYFIIDGQKYYIKIYKG